jgi:hypothetical protein
MTDRLNFKIERRQLTKNNRKRFFKRKGAREKRRQNAAGCLFARAPLFLREKLLETK